MEKNILYTIYCVFLHFSSNNEFFIRFFRVKSDFIRISPLIFPENALYSKKVSHILYILRIFLLHFRGNFDIIILYEIMSFFNVKILFERKITKMKKISFKKVMASVAALSVVSCMAAIPTAAAGEVSAKIEIVHRKTFA